MAMSNQKETMKLWFNRIVVEASGQSKDERAIESKRMLQHKMTFKLERWHPKKDNQYRKKRSTQTQSNALKKKTCNSLKMRVAFATPRITLFLNTQQITWSLCEMNICSTTQMHNKQTKQIDIQKPNWGCLIRLPLGVLRDMHVFFVQLPACG